jgi:ferredoxin-NADP reductase
VTHRVSILSKVPLNHDVIQFRLERPDGFEFNPGQAIELTLETQKLGPAPFTFTGLQTSPYLELSIKIYKDHHGLTESLSNLNVGDKVTITDPWDSFTNKGAGIFIAGGAGITPFIALLRHLHNQGKIGDSHLFFSNKTPDDIFLHDELKSILGERYIDVITRDEKVNAPHRIDETFLRQNVANLKQPFYVCGPPGFVDGLQELLKTVGAADEVVNISL